MEEFLDIKQPTVLPLAALSPLTINSNFSQTCPASVTHSVKTVLSSPLLKCGSPTESEFPFHVKKVRKFSLLLRCTLHTTAAVAFCDISRVPCGRRTMLMSTDAVKGNDRKKDKYAERY